MLQLHSHLFCISFHYSCDFDGGHAHIVMVTPNSTEATMACHQAGLSGKNVVKDDLCAQALID